MAKVESLYGTTSAEIFEGGLENVGDIAAGLIMARFGFQN